MLVVPDIAIKALNTHDRRLLSVSGGPDSMLLLLWCWEHRGDRDLLVWTGNHGQRSDADCDVGLVQSWCNQYGVECIVGYYDGVHTETAMRHRRRASLLAIATEKNACILTGHHLDDRIETVLYRLWKGTGLVGMSALPAVQCGDVCWVRPLVSITKEDILNLCQCYGLSYRVDVTNFSHEGGPRNRMRHVMVPLMMSDDFYSRWRQWFNVIDDWRKRLSDSYVIDQLPSPIWWGNAVQCRGIKLVTDASWTPSIIIIALSQLGIYRHQNSAGIDVLLHFFAGKSGRRLDYGSVVLRWTRRCIYVTSGGAFWERTSGFMCDDWRLARQGDKMGSSSLTRVLQKAGVPLFWRSSVLVREEDGVIVDRKMPIEYDSWLIFTG